MSFEAVAWAGSCESVTKPTDAFVLTILASFVGPDGVCWCGQETLRKRTRYRDRAVRLALTSLEELGVIKRFSRRRNDGSRKCDLYVLAGFVAEEGIPFPADNEMLQALNIVAEDWPSPINRHEVPVAKPDTNRHHVPHAPTGTSCRNNRHLMPEQPAPHAGYYKEESSKESSTELDPLSPEDGGNGSDRLEGFDLFMSVWPDDWPGVRGGEKLLRSRWRAAVDRLGADAVLASARNYLAKAQAVGGTKASVGYFLARKSGLVRKFLPADAPAAVIEPVVLSDSDEHRFLAECREAGASEAQIRRWAEDGAFRIKRDGPLVAAVAEYASDQFQTAFASVLQAHGMSAYSQQLWQRRMARKARTA